MSSILDRLRKRKTLYINELQFTSRCECWAFGFIEQAGIYHPSQWFLNADDLKEVLKGSAVGAEVEMKVEREFVHPHAVPVEISLIDLFGMTQIFEI